MTKDELIRMADLAGFDVDEDEVYAPAAGRYGLDPRLEHFARLVAAQELQYCASICQREIKKIKEREKNKRERLRQDEREACAKLCEEQLENTMLLTSYPPKSAAAFQILQLIKARGDKHD